MIKVNISIKEVSNKRPVKMNFRKNVINEDSSFVVIQQQPNSLSCPREISLSYLDGANQIRNPKSAIRNLVAPAARVQRFVGRQPCCARYLYQEASLRSEVYGV